MRNIDSKSRPRTQFRFKYLAVRIRLLRLGGSLTTFSTVSVKSGHFAVQSPCPANSGHCVSKERQPRGGLSKFQFARYARRSFSSIYAGPDRGNRVSRRRLGLAARDVVAGTYARLE